MGQNSKPIDTQQWVGPKDDYATSFGVSERFDVTDRLLRMDVKSITCLCDDTQEADELVRGKHSHNGPFIVYVRGELEYFCQIYGLTDPSDLSENHLAELRILYGIDTLVPEKPEIVWHTVIGYNQDVNAADNAGGSIQELLKQFCGVDLICSSVLSEKYNETGLIFTRLPVSEALAIELYDEERDEELGISECRESLQ